MKRTPTRWQTLALYDVHRARMWQVLICSGVVLAFALIVGVIWAAVFI